MSMVCVCNELNKIKVLFVPLSFCGIQGAFILKKTLKSENYLRRNSCVFRHTNVKMIRRNRFYEVGMSQSPFKVVCTSVTFCI